MVTRTKITKIVAWLYLVLLASLPVDLILSFTHLRESAAGISFYLFLLFLPIVSVLLLVLGSMAWKDKPRSRFISIVTVVNYILFLPIVAAVLFFVWFFFAIITGAGGVM